MAAIEGSAEHFSAIADSTLKTTTSQYRAVYCSGNKTYALAETATVFATGINMSYLSASAADPADIRLFGPTRAIANASITANAYVQAVAGGAVAEVANTTTANALGYAMESGSTGQAIMIFVNPKRASA